LLKMQKRREEGQGAELTSVNKWQAGHRVLPEVGKEQRQQTTGFRLWAPTVRQFCSI
jgi:hypothetical protein